MSYRVGHVSNPCDFPPAKIYSWNNRFDDSRRRYRTIYCADRALTCLREVLADFRANQQAIAEFESLFGKGSGSQEPFGTVPRGWSQSHVLAQASIIEDTGRIVDIESAGVLKHLRQRHGGALLALGHKKFRKTLLRSRNRALTQAFSRTLFDLGHAGIKLSSRLDGKPCAALFEGRARLKLKGRSRPLSGRPKELLAVCREFGLELER